MTPTSLDRIRGRVFHVLYPGRAQVDLFKGEQMKRLVAVGISIGILAGLFTWFAFGVLTQVGDWKTPLVVWVGFAACACFYAVGGGTTGLVTNLGSAVAGLSSGRPGRTVCAGPPASSNLITLTRLPCQPHEVFTHPRKDHPS
ncbi:DUF1097 domain-containing protein [Dermatophilaceae bacterium Soc4.6]